MTQEKYSKEDAYYTLNLINSWINNIDAKTSFALAFVVVLVGFILEKNPMEFFCENLPVEEVSVDILLKLFLVSALYITSFGAAIFFFLAIVARTKNASGKKSMMFFGTIAAMELNDYKARTLNMDEKNLVKDLLEQIHTNAVICDKKMKYYNIGMRFLLGTTVLGGVMSIFNVL